MTSRVGAVSDAVELVASDSRADTVAAAFLLLWVILPLLFTLYGETTQQGGE